MAETKTLQISNTYVPHLLLSWTFIMWLNSILLSSTSSHDAGSFEISQTSHRTEKETSLPKSSWGVMTETVPPDEGEMLSSKI